MKTKAWTDDITYKTDASGKLRPWLEDSEILDWGWCPACGHRAWRPVMESGKAYNDCPSCGSDCTPYRTPDIESLVREHGSVE